MIRRLLLSAAAVALSGPALAQTAGYSAPWLTQAGITAAVEATANGGNGLSIGFVDSGVAASNSELLGRVSPLSGCAAVSFACAQGALDDAGHGTATAAIAAGSMAGGGSMAGVAPGALVIAEKALDANGNGTVADVANAIVKAADAGAAVINLSLSYTADPSVISAVNYAAGKGAVLVFAGGNDGGALNGGASTAGLSPAALSRLVFVGSVNSANQLSSFSNVPGTAGAAAGSGTVPYASLWVMAPGESIVAPGIMYGPQAYAYWTGTSMAAPVISGALALLEATWPVLARNGTAAAVLFNSATDLGASGVDPTYGNGLINLSRAFQPIGPLTITEAGGGTVPLSQLTPSLVTGGALGSLSALGTQLSSYTSFDSYQRNFLVDLSGLISQRSTAAQVVAAAQAPAVTATTTPLSGGGEMAFARAEAPPLLVGATGFVQDPTAAAWHGTAPWAAELTETDGTVLAAGHGLPATASFADALWGAQSAGGQQARGLGVSNALLGLAEGGPFTAFGSKIGAHTRLAAAWSDSRDATASPLTDGWTTAKATAFAAGMTTRLAAGWTGGLTVGVLDERDGLLGSVYQGGGALGLGRQHDTVSVGLASSFALGDKTALMLDAALARSSGAAVSTGLITEVSPLIARAYGASLVQRDVFGDGDRLSLSLTKPLRVTTGSVRLATTTVDAQGYPVTGTTRVGLRPSGSETDLALGYATPWRRGVDLTASLGADQDAQNVRGATETILQLGLKVRF